MMETATELRTAVITLLQAAGIVPSGHVWDSPTEPWEEADDLPVLRVFSDSTTPAPISKTSLVYATRHRIAVQWIGEGTDNAQVAAAVDDAEGKVLRAVLNATASGTFTPSCSATWSSTDKTMAAQDMIRGSAVVTFEFETNEEFAAPALEQLDLLHVDVDPQPQNEDRPHAGWEVSL